MKYKMHLNIQKYRNFDIHENNISDDEYVNNFVRSRILPTHFDGGINFMMAK